VIDFSYDETNDNTIMCSAYDTQTKCNLKHVLDEPNQCNNTDMDIKRQAIINAYLNEGLYID